MKNQIYIENPKGKMFLGHWVIVETQETPSERCIDCGKILYLALYYGIFMESQLIAKFDKGTWVRTTEDEYLNSILEDTILMYNKY